MPPKKTGKKGGASSKAKQLKAEQSVGLSPKEEAESSNFLHLLCPSPLLSPSRRALHHSVVLSSERRTPPHSAKLINQSTTPALPSPNSTATLDIIAHPYILTLIIEASPRSTLVTFLRCSKEVFKLTAPSLYKHLRLSCKQFDKLIETGNAPSKRGSTSGILGRSFSPFLRYALENVTSLHISDSSLRWAPPVVPRGCFANVKHLFIVRTPSWRDRNYDLLSLPTDILSRLSKEVKSLTIILQRTGWGNAHLRSRNLHKLEGFANAGKSLTVVLEPSTYHSFDHVPWDSSSDVWSNFSSPSIDSPRRYDIRIVGSRFGTAPATGHNAGTSPSTCRPSFVEFTEWLAGLGDEPIYTAEEEALLRGHDRRIRFKPAPVLYQSVSHLLCISILLFADVL